MSKMLYILLLHYTPVSQIICFSLCSPLLIVQLDLIGAGRPERLTSVERPTVGVNWASPVLLTSSVYLLLPVTHWGGMFTLQHFSRVDRTMENYKPEQQAGPILWDQKVLHLKCAARPHPQTCSVVRLQLPVLRPVQCRPSGEHEIRYHALLFGSGLPNEAMCQNP